jgi:8-oxo-dGTP diphosphatase
MKLYLVRHAKAGSRSRWQGDDIDRPLSPGGWRQAEAIADRLVALGITTLLSSPFLRCRQTLAPTAKRLDLTVCDDERLAEGQAYEGVVDLLTTLPAGAVMCTHGDVLPDTIAALQRRGCVIAPPPDWRKGTVWELERKRNGTISRAQVWPPPA